MATRTAPITKQVALTGTETDLGALFGETEGKFRLTVPSGATSSVWLGKKDVVITGDDGGGVYVAGTRVQLPTTSLRGWFAITNGASVTITLECATGGADAPDWSDAGTTSPGGGGGGGGEVTQGDGDPAKPWYMQGVNGGTPERLATHALQGAGLPGTLTGGGGVKVGLVDALPTGANSIGTVVSTNAAASQADGHSASIGSTADADTALTLIGRIKNLLSRIPAALVGGRFDGNVGSWLGSTVPTIGQKVSANSIPVAIASDQTAVSVKDVVWEVSSLGTYQGRAAKSITLVGRRTAFFANVFNDLGQFTLPGGGGALFGEMTGLEQLEIVSGNANDTALGTGARTIKITYIDALAGGVEANVTISLNGTTPVSLGVVRALAIQYMEVATVGSGDVAAGNITLRTTIAGTQWDQILLGYGRSMAGRYMVPTGQTAYLVPGTATARAQFMDLELLANTLEDDTPSGYTTHNAFDVPSNGALALDLPYQRFQAGTKIKWSAVPGSAAGGPRCQVSWTMLLIANA